jgi:hypothetical protein
MEPHTFLKKLAVPVNPSLPLSCSLDMHLRALSAGEPTDCSKTCLRRLHCPPTPKKLGANTCLQLCLPVNYSTTILTLDSPSSKCKFSTVSKSSSPASSFPTASLNEIMKGSCHFIILPPGSGMPGIGAARLVPIPPLASYYEASLSNCWNTSLLLP